jgi:hypothetical protein
VHNSSNYSSINFASWQLEYATNNIFSNFQGLTNNTTITKNSKKYQIQSKLYQKKDVIKMLQNFQTSNRAEQIQNEEKKINDLLLNSSKKNFIFSDFFFNKRLGHFKRLTNEQFLLLTPKLIANYITNQLKKKRILEQQQFKASLNVGILSFSQALLKQLQKNIIGLKIICSGK